MANILYKKLQQAKDEYFKESSKLFDSYSSANIDSNKSKKISAISYWIEILTERIVECTKGTTIDPAPITYSVGEDFNLTFLGTTQSFDKVSLLVRNKFRTLVPVASFMYYGQLDIASNWSVINGGISQTQAQGYNNFDPGLNLVALSNPYRFELRFIDVGDMYNGMFLESSNNSVTLAPKKIIGGVSPNKCNSLTTEEYNYYDEILNIISIELGFNYSNTELETTEYNNILTGDNKNSITLNSGESLEL